MAWRAYSMAVCRLSETSRHRSASRSASSRGSVGSVRPITSAPYDLPCVSSGKASTFSGPIGQSTWSSAERGMAGSDLRRSALLRSSLCQTCASLVMPVRSVR
ncbi:hypothetical protein [Nonomuraea salmonea]|uniref:hypothetical protein n=1 Tax=Nonomuraea salmonea TaxID=46181 RepID=UPI0031E95CE3